MTPASPNEDPGLFPVQEALPDYSGRETDYSSDERILNLTQALDLYDQVADIEGTIRKFRDPKWLKEQQDSLGKNVAYKWRRQQYEKHQELLDSAKEAFQRAYPLEMFVAQGLSEQEATEELGRQYGTFEQVYRGTSQGRREKRRQARKEYKLYLTGEQAVLDNPNTDVEPTIAEALARKALTGALASETGPVLEPELAETKDKLIGLRDDKRAGFLPTTHTEKNQAFELLDYMDNPQYPTGVNKRLDEIARHQQEIAQNPKYGKNLKGSAIYEYSQQAITSVVNEWGDHLHNAVVSHAQLSKLKELLDSGISPRISTAEAIADEEDPQFDYNVLVRFLNLKSLRDGKAFDFDPLKTREDRSIVHPDKNKIIEDSHTAVGSLIQIQDYIDGVAEELSVKDGRTLINEALADQVSRQNFWKKALNAVTEEGFADKAQKALDTALGHGTTAA